MRGRRRRTPDRPRCWGRTTTGSTLFAVRSLLQHEEWGNGHRIVRESVDRRQTPRAAVGRAKSRSAGRDVLAVHPTELLIRAAPMLLISRSLSEPRPIPKHNCADWQLARRLRSDLLRP